MELHCHLFILRVMIRIGFEGDGETASFDGAPAQRMLDAVYQFIKNHNPKDL